VISDLAYKRWPGKGWKIDKLLGFCPYGGAFRVDDLLGWTRESARHGEHAPALRLCELGLEQAPIDAALLVECGLAACNLADAERASRYAFRVSEAKRAPIRKACAQKRVPLDPPRSE
jgi:hypothetical protein